jgi:uncharacterized protein (UPF0335 family)
VADNPDIEGGANSATVAAGQLRAFIERRERLEEEKATIGEDIKELNAEVKGMGYNMRAFNEMVKLRKLDKAERDEREAMRNLYGEALGVFG